MSVLSPQPLTSSSFSTSRVNDPGAGRSTHPLIIVASDSSSEFVRKIEHHSSGHLRYSGSLRCLHPSIECSEQSNVPAKKKIRLVLNIHHIPPIPMEMRRRHSSKESICSRKSAVIQGFWTALALFHHHRPPTHEMERCHLNPG